MKRNYFVVKALYIRNKRGCVSFDAPSLVL